MDFNFLALLLAAFSTLIVGFIWYNPKVFGTIWMRESGVTNETMKGNNMIAIFAMSLLYAFFIAFTLQFLVIHQFSAYSATVDVKNVDPSILKNYMDVYGNTFKTFKHGAFHGIFTGLFLALPIIGVGALYERRSWKYVLIAGGYWIVTCTIMGAIICGMK
ncbi:DUF1761 domain-containing protein [Flavobacterium sp.]|uniref:DUF1761 domain-containing protein n=1 Tax=Flavobacterium sp. TaxID=239 RepID=UPI003752194A